MEVYIHDMLVKSKEATRHMEDFKECFDILREYQMKLNPIKCVFGVEFGKFLGFMINHWGIEVNPAKVQAVIDLHSLRSTKKVQKLTGIIAALSRFVA